MPTKPTKTTKPDTRKRAVPVLSLAVQYAAGMEELPNRAQFRRWVRAALDGGVVGAAITLRIVGAVEGRQLNARYRRGRHATNVLSFDDDISPSPRTRRMLSGDIVFCAPVIAREARVQGKTLAAHYAHLTVHGMLHLQGYDHRRDSDANSMERLETAILKRLGWPDPYQPQPTAAKHKA